ncbi:MAG TPA: cold shock domain-containing protein [Candidatus Xenobia bacterium]|jgi:cold shock CspA family protein/ribosome-associated translation inhibitor RaiA
MIANLEIEGQKVDILPEYRAVIDKELARIERLARYPITNLRLELIATPHHRHGAFEVRLVLRHGTETLALVRQGEEVLPLLSEAFEVLGRRLDEDVARRAVLPHEPVSRLGTILRFNPDHQYGFLDGDGQEVYFHLHAVKRGSVSDLVPGTKVRYASEDGEKGPQATWVRVD